MVPTIYGLSYDYRQSSGNVLVFFTPEGLSNDAFQPIQKKMMQFNRVERLLPAAFDEIDFKTEITFNFTGKHILAHHITGTSLQTDHVFDFMEQVAQIIENGQEYMLSADSFVLNPEHIFVSSDGKKLHLIYLPLKQLPDKPNVQEDLRSLLIFFLGKVQDMHQEGIYSLLTALQDKHFSLKQFRETIVVYKEEHSSRQPEQSVTQNQDENSIQHEKQRETVKSDQSHDKTKLKKEKKTKPKSDKQSEKKKKKAISNEKDASTPTLSVTRKEWSVFILVLCLIGLPLTRYPREGLVYFDLGLSLLLANSWMWLKYKGYTGKSVKAVTEISDMNVSETAEQKYYEKISQETALLSSSNETALLSDLKKNPYLQREQGKAGGVNGRVEIISDSFIIGKGPEGVDYSDSSHGVSRIHCEIYKGDDGAYGVKDLGSKNGTVLNGQKLVPYKRYPLQAGDEIFLIRNKYRFFLS